jgi:hypothetical protein
MIKPVFLFQNSSILIILLLKKYNTHPINVLIMRIYMAPTKDINKYDFGIQKMFPKKYFINNPKMIETDIIK